MKSVLTVDQNSHIKYKFMGNSKIPRIKALQNAESKLHKEPMPALPNNKVKILDPVKLFITI